MELQNMYHTNDMIEYLIFKRGSACPQVTDTISAPVPIFVELTGWLDLGLDLILQPSEKQYKMKSYPFIGI